LLMETYFVELFTLFHKFIVPTFYIVILPQPVIKKKKPGSYWHVFFV